jgi:uncharacterized protein involved in cysteine biosynthesis
LIPLKGVLDYFLFSLVARKLISDSYLPEREKSFCTNLLAWLVAIPLELIRFSTAIVLTFFLAPIVALGRFIESYFMKSDVAEILSNGTIPNKLENDMFSIARSCH